MLLWINLRISVTVFNNDYVLAYTYINIGLSIYLAELFNYPVFVKP